jgi:hypothetical protein
MATYKLHDANSQNEVSKNSYYYNLIQYDHNEDYLATVRLESYYAAVVLLDSKPTDSEPYVVEDLQTLPETYNVDLTIPILNDGFTYSYGVCLFNKYCGFNTVRIKKPISADKISDVLYKTHRTKQKYHDHLALLNKELYWFITTHSEEALTLSLNEIATLNLQKYKAFYKKLPENPHIGQHIYEAVTERLYNAIPHHYKTYKLTKVKFNKTQLARMMGAIGYISDDKNIIDSKPLSVSVINGVDEESFFRTSYGTRKGINDKLFCRF